MDINDIQLPSNRRFGLFFSIIFAGLAIYFWVKGGNSYAMMAFVGLAILTVGITLFRSDALLPLNKAWMGLGLLLGKIVNPIVVGAIFFLIITPVALIMRLGGRDELRIKRQVRQSYWKQRIPSDLEPSSFKRQF